MLIHTYWSIFIIAASKSLIISKSIMDCIFHGSFPMDILLILHMLSNFLLYSGHFEYYVVSLGVLFKSVEKVGILVLAGHPSS